MSSYESSSAKSGREEGDGGDNGRPVCSCGVKTVQFVARRENKNWGRRFFRCRNYKNNPKCFFRWIDEEFSERATEVISEGRTREKVLEAEIMKLKQHMKVEPDCEMERGKMKVTEKEKLVKILREVEHLRRIVWLLVTVLLVGILNWFVAGKMSD